MARIPLILPRLIQRISEEKNETQNIRFEHILDPYVPINSQAKALWVMVFGPWHPSIPGPSLPGLSADPAEVS